MQDSGGSWNTISPSMTPQTSAKRRKSGFMFGTTMPNFNSTGNLRKSIARNNLMSAGLRGNNSDLQGLINDDQ